uniref:Interleukin-4 n=1 Tax=Serinus canaria TaxID=9135 RepID=A0A8C9NBD6_SERCA
MLSQRKVMSTGLTVLLGPGGGWMCVCVCASGWVCAVWSLIAPLLCVFIKVSCDKMNVINIFEDHKRRNNTEILCKAATIAQEVKSCHKDLGGVYFNLLNPNSTPASFLTILFPFQEPCPVASGNTTSLKHFLKKLDHVLQEEFKNQN